MLTRAQASALRACVERLLDARIRLCVCGNSLSEDHVAVSAASVVARRAHTEFNDRLRRLTEKGPAK